MFCFSKTKLFEQMFNQKKPLTSLDKNHNVFPFGHSGEGGVGGGRGRCWKKKFLLFVYNFISGKPPFTFL